MSDARPTLLGAHDLETVASVLLDGGVVGLPTDTVYGLAVRLERSAIDRVLAAKGRPSSLALPVLVGVRAQLDAVASSFPPAAAVLAERFWPGPLTLVVPAKRAIGRLVGGDGRTVGLRWPDHPFVEQLCLEVGPLAVTSANRHGEPPSTTADEVAGAFLAKEVVAVVDGGVADSSPSSVVDCSRKRPTSVREGAVPWSAIESALAG
jgi:tRNA threonylcarbamoyl adenosine modification protein (Sua5/YciO/YrdC/YwlC family)